MRHRFALDPFLLSAMVRTRVETSSGRRNSGIRFRRAEKVSVPGFHFSLTVAP